MHFTDFADQSGGDPLGHLTDAFAGVALIAHLGHDIVLMGGLGEDARFEDGMGDRLLHVDVLAAAHAFHRDVGVRMVGRSDDDGVDVLLLVEHLAEIGVEGGLGLLLDRAAATAEIQVAERDDVLFGGIADVARADAAEADRGHVQLLVGRDRAGGRIEPRAGDREGGGGHASIAKEGPAVELRCHGVGVSGFYDPMRRSQVPCTPTCLSETT